MKIYIKNMIGEESILLVKKELDRFAIAYEEITLGEITFKEDISNKDLLSLTDALSSSNLEILSEKKSLLIEKIKRVIVDMIHNTDELPLENYSIYIANKLEHNYTYLANIFSDTQGITIEHFIISNKIEKVKFLLLNNELNLTEISYKLHYSSVSHLSNQFKKVTGLTPSYYKNKNKLHKQS